eukprot:s857_g30.t1
MHKVQSRNSLGRCLEFGIFKNCEILQALRAAMTNFVARRSRPHNQMSLLSEPSQCGKAVELWGSHVQLNSGLAVASNPVTLSESTCLPWQQELVIPLYREAVAGEKHPTQAAWHVTKCVWHSVHPDVTLAESGVPRTLIFAVFKALAQHKNNSKHVMLLQSWCALRETWGLGTFTSNKACNVQFIQHVKLPLYLAHTAAGSQLSGTTWLGHARTLL